MDKEMTNLIDEQIVEQIIQDRISKQNREKAIRTAALSQRDELLREALEALDRAKALVDGALANAHDLTPKITQTTLERVQLINRAAADIIRAAMTQEKQT